MRDQFAFYRKVRQAAFEVQSRHHGDAHLYAASLAEEAKSAGDGDDYRFWSAVAASLTPRMAAS